MTAVSNELAAIIDITKTHRSHNNGFDATPGIKSSSDGKLITYTTLGETVREVGLGGSQDSSRGTEENGRGLHLDELSCCRLDLFVCKKM